MPDTKQDTKYSEVPASEDKKEAVGLKAQMTLMNGITVIVGSIIGSGIFVAPTGVLVGTGSPNMALVVWVASGVFSLVGAYCYAELGCMISKSGADYAYIMVTFGPFLAFIRLWVECMIVRPCSQAIVALTFSTYVLKPFFQDCNPPDESLRLLAATVICFLTFVNCWNVKWATLIQDWFTYAKLLALFMIIVTGFVQLYNGKTEYFTWEKTEQDPTKVALSFYSGLFAYNGWNYLNFIIEEMKNPVRDLPRAIGISCILVMVVYVFTNMAFFTTLSPTEIYASQAVAETFAQRLYGSYAWVIPVAVAMSTFGAVNGILLTSSRLFYAGAMEGQMPEVLTMIQTEKSTPAPAVLFVALLSLLYLTSSDIGLLINYVGFATWLSIGAAVACIPILRWKQPDLPRPIKVNMFWPVSYIICTIIITVVPMFADPITTGIGLLVILSAVPVYFLFIGWKKKPRCVQDFFKFINRSVQIICIALPPAQKQCGQTASTTLNDSFMKTPNCVTDNRRGRNWSGQHNSKIQCANVLCFDGSNMSSPNEISTLISSPGSGNAFKLLSRGRLILREEIADQNNSARTSSSSNNNNSRDDQDPTKAPDRAATNLRWYY